MVRLLMMTGGRYHVDHVTADEWLAIQDKSRGPLGFPAGFRGKILDTLSDDEVVEYVATINESLDDMVSGFRAAMGASKGD